MNGGVPSLWAALTIDWWETESNALLTSMKVRFSICFCSLFFFMIALTSHTLSARPSPCLKAFWRFERGQYVSILLLSMRWNNLPMIGPTVIGLKSPGLSVPCFFGIQVTIPFLSASGGHPMNSQNVMWVDISSRSRILQILQSLNDFLRRDRTSISSKVSMALSKGLESPLYFWMKNFS